MNIDELPGRISVDQEFARLAPLPLFAVVTGCLDPLTPGIHQVRLKHPRGVIRHRGKHPLIVRLIR